MGGDVTPTTTPAAIGARKGIQATPSRNRRTGMSLIPHRTAADVGFGDTDRDPHSGASRPAHASLPAPRTHLTREQGQLVLGSGTLKAYLTTRRVVLPWPPGRLVERPTDRSRICSALLWDLSGLTRLTWAHPTGQRTGRGTGGAPTGPRPVGAPCTPSRSIWPPVRIPTCRRPLPPRPRPPRRRPAARWRPPRVPQRSAGRTARPGNRPDARPRPDVVAHRVLIPRGRRPTHVPRDRNLGGSGTRRGPAARPDRHRPLAIRRRAGQPPARVGYLQRKRHSTTGTSSIS